MVAPATGMFTAIPNEILQYLWDNSAPATVTVVLVNLYWRSNAEGESWWSQAKMADQCGLSRDTVIKAIKWLEEHDLLQVERSSGGGSRYYLPRVLKGEKACRKSRPPVSEKPTPPIIRTEKDPKKKIQPPKRGREDLILVADPVASLPLEVTGWWLEDPDPVLCALGGEIMAVPKFARWLVDSGPDHAALSKLLAVWRKVSPGDQSILYEIEKWGIYNRKKSKKGGDKDAVASLRNWVGGKFGDWELAKLRSRNGSRGASSPSESLEDRVARRVNSVTS